MRMVIWYDSLSFSGAPIIGNIDLSVAWEASTRWSIARIWDRFLILVCKIIIKQKKCCFLSSYISLFDVPLTGSLRHHVLVVYKHVFYAYVEHWAILFRYVEQGWTCLYVVISGGIFRSSLNNILKMLSK